jgi:hypothetical protein
MDDSLVIQLNADFRQRPKLLPEVAKLVISAVLQSTLHTLKIITAEMYSRHASIDIHCDNDILASTLPQQGKTSVYPDIFCGIIVSADGKCLKIKLVPGSKTMNVFDNHCEREHAYTSVLKTVLEHLPPSRCFAPPSRHLMTFTYASYHFYKNCDLPSFAGYGCNAASAAKMSSELLQIFGRAAHSSSEGFGKADFEEFKLNLMQFPILTRQYGHRSNPL